MQLFGERGLRFFTQNVQLFGYLLQATGKRIRPFGKMFFESVVFFLHGIGMFSKVLQKPVFYRFLRFFHLGRKLIDTGNGLIKFFVIVGCLLFIFGKLCICRLGQRGQALRCLCRRFFEAGI